MPLIEHGCSTGDHLHVARGAILAGDVNARDYAYIGSGTIVRQGITNTEVGTRWSRFGYS